METVSTSEGIAYGFHLLGYLVGLGVVAWLTAVGTFAVVSNSNFFLGFLIAVIGGLIIIAGLFGLSYKVISDGVQNGVLKAK